MSELTDLPGYREQQAELAAGRQTKGARRSEMTPVVEAVARKLIPEMERRGIKNPSSVKIVEVVIDLLAANVTDEMVIAGFEAFWECEGLPERSEAWKRALAAAIRAALTAPPTETKS